MISSALLAATPADIYLRAADALRQAARACEMFPGSSCTNLAQAEWAVRIGRHEGGVSVHLVLGRWQEPGVTGDV